MKVVITDESLVPDELCEVTMKFPFKYLSGMKDFFARDDVDFGPRVPRLSAIYDALNQPCGCCENGQVRCSDEYAETMDCPDCNGTGKASVPGVRLKEMTKEDRDAK